MNRCAELAELEEEHGGDEGAFSELDKVNKVSVAARLKDISDDAELKDEMGVLQKWLTLNERETDLQKETRAAEAELDALTYARYPKLTEAEVKRLAVDDKWLVATSSVVQGEIDQVNRVLTLRLTELAERYQAPLPTVTRLVSDSEMAVAMHLEKMGFSWG